MALQFILRSSSIAKCNVQSISEVDYHVFVRFQAAYNAYGYASYGAPQIPMPTSAPQTAVAYGSYPPAYPAQVLTTWFLIFTRRNYFIS